MVDSVQMERFVETARKVGAQVTSVASAEEAVAYVRDHARGPIVLPAFALGLCGAALRRWVSSERSGLAALIDTPPRARQLLSGLDPRLGCRWQRPQQFGNSLFVVWRIRRHGQWTG